MNQPPCICEYAINKRNQAQQDNVPAFIVVSPADRQKHPQSVSIKPYQAILILEPTEEDVTEIEKAVSECNAIVGILASAEQRYKGESRMFINASIAQDMQEYTDAISSLINRGICIYGFPAYLSAHTRIVSTSRGMIATLYKSVEQREEETPINIGEYNELFALYSKPAEEETRRTHQHEIDALSSVGDSESIKQIMSSAYINELDYLTQSTSIPHLDQLLFVDTLGYCIGKYECWVKNKIISHSQTFDAIVLRDSEKVEKVLKHVIDTYYVPQTANRTAQGCSEIGKAINILIHYHYITDDESKLRVLSKAICNKFQINIANWQGVKKYYPNKEIKQEHPLTKEILSILEETSTAQLE